MDIRRATTRKDLEAVWRLTHDQYVAEGYAEPQPEIRKCPRCKVENPPGAAFCGQCGQRM